MITLDDLFKQDPKQTLENKQVVYDQTPYKLITNFYEKDGTMRIDAKQLSNNETQKPGLVLSFPRSMFCTIKIPSDQTIEKHPSQTP